MTTLAPIVALLFQIQLAAVEGLVTKPGGSEPLAGARVTLTLEGAPAATAEPKIVVTEDDGRFVFRDVPAGAYALTAESSRYGPASYGQRRPGGPATTLSLQAGQTVSGLKIFMVATGTIAGRITGRNGEPAVNALVQALKYGYRDGTRTLVPAQSTTTNDFGEYRLFWLPPGQYVVGAMTDNPDRLFRVRPPVPLAPGAAVWAADPWAAPSILLGRVLNRLLDDGTSREEAWVPTYYPAATAAAQGAPIDVAAGATRTGVNIAIAPSRVQWIRGQVLGLPAGSAPTVMLQDQDSEFFLRTRGIPTGTAGISSFEFSGILTGSYVLTTRDPMAGYTGTLPVEVGDRDIDGLRLGVTPGITLSGKVVLENSSGNAPDPSLLSSMRLILGQGNSAISQISLPFQPESGAFILTNVAPGEYQVRIDRYPFRPPDEKILYVKTIRLGQTESANNIQVTSATQDRLEIVLTTELGSLEGSAANAQGIVPGATVVVVPAVARKNANLYKSAIADSAGRFRFETIVPGDYKLFAWDDVETGAWQDPEFMKIHESRGRNVRIPGNSKQDVQLQVISNP